MVAPVADAAPINYAYRGNGFTEVVELFTTSGHITATVTIDFAGAGVYDATSWTLSAWSNDLQQHRVIHFFSGGGGDPGGPRSFKLDASGAIIEWWLEGLREPHYISGGWIVRSELDTIALETPRTTR